MGLRMRRPFAPGVRPPARWRAPATAVIAGFGPACFGACRSLNTGDEPRYDEAAVRTLVRGGVARAVGRPHLFEIVELAHFRPEHVHDDGADVDQHPVALRLAFDVNAAVPGFFNLRCSWSAIAPTWRSDRPEAITM